MTITEDVARAMYESTPVELVGGDNDRTLNWDEFQDYFGRASGMVEDYWHHAQAAIDACRSHIEAEARQRHRDELFDELEELKAKLYAQEPLVNYALNMKRMTSPFQMAGGVGAHKAFDEYERRTQKGADHG